MQEANEIFLAQIFAILHINHHPIENTEVVRAAPITCWDTEEALMP
jgi:hypothetical protein